MGERSTDRGAWRRVFLRGMLALVLAVGSLPGLAYADEPEAPTVPTVSIDEPHAADEVIVVYESALNGARTFSLDGEPDIESLGYDIADQLGDGLGEGESAIVASVPEGKRVEDAIAELEDAPGVAFAQPNYEYSLFDEASAEATTSDPYCRSAGEENQWYLWSSDVPQAWDLARSDGSVTVAVLDTGCRLDHEDLAGSIDAAHAYDTFRDAPLAAGGTGNGDAVGHGTHVCGVIGARANNGVGIAGASYNAKILPIKVFSDDAYDPKARTSDIVQAYQYLQSLVDSGSLPDLRVVNMSLGYYADGSSQGDRLLERSISALRDRGALTVCAGGNGDKYGNPCTGKSIPSDFDECLSVTSLDRDGGNSYWSDYNKYKDISAPGVSVLSTVSYTASSYGVKSGTSMASPLVAGVACLLWSANPNLTVDQVVAALLDNADPVIDAENDRRATSGSKGALNAEASVRAVIGDAPPEPEPEPEPVEPPKPALVPLSSCTVSAIADQTYTGSALRPKPVVKHAGATLIENVDYTLAYRNNVDVGRASVVVTGRGSFTGSKTISFSIVAQAPSPPAPDLPKKASARRLAGGTALGTMAAVSAYGFAAGSCESVVVATLEGYWDALTASSIAGLKRCPVLITEGSSLSPETASEIKRLGARTVYIAGGSAAVSDGVKAAISSLPGVAGVVRLAGATAVDTALKIYEAGKGSWGRTAVVATSATFHDALAASPYAYAKGAPVFLANASTHRLDDRVLSAIRSGGFERVLIAGGAAAISSGVERQLSGLTCVRKGGATAYETSSAIASWCVSQGMRSSAAGVATGESYYDALTGAALCGKSNAALVLVSDGNRSAVSTFLDPRKGSLSSVFVFGGPAAVSDATFSEIRAALG